MRIRFTLTAEESVRSVYNDNRTKENKVSVRIETSPFRLFTAFSAEFSFSLRRKESVPTWRKIDILTRYHDPFFTALLCESILFSFARRSGLFR